MSFLDTGMSCRMLKSDWIRLRISSASLTPAAGSPRNVVTTALFVSGPGPCGRICAPSSDGKADTANAAASPAAESAERCETFTVVTSKALTKVHRTCRAGSADRARATALHGRRGTRTPDILRVRQAL